MKLIRSAMPMVAAVALAFGASAYGQTVSKDQHRSEMERIKAEYDAAKNRCDTLSGNAKDICMAEAKGQEKVAKAQLDAREKNTEKARYDARVAKAEADYDVAKERCDDRSGNEKDVCQKEAKATFERAKVDAKTERKVSDVRKDATEDKREAEYRVAKERCDSLSGDAKTRCINEAKSRYGRS